MASIPLSLPLPQRWATTQRTDGGIEGVVRGGAGATRSPKPFLSCYRERSERFVAQPRSSAIGAIRDFHRGPPRLLAREERVRCQSPASSSSAPPAAARPHGVGLCPAARRCLGCGRGGASDAIRRRRACPWLRPGPPIRPSVRSAAAADASETINEARR